MLVSLVIALALSAPVMDSTPPAAPATPPVSATPAAQAPAAAVRPEQPTASLPAAPPAVSPAPPAVLPAPPAVSPAPPAVLPAPPVVPPAPSVVPGGATLAETPPASPPRRTPFPPAHSFHLALGAGVAIPSGKAAVGVPMSDVTGEQLDLLLELGARFFERYYFDGYLEIGEGDTAGATADCKSCSVRRTAVGLEAKYAFAPRGRFNPWMGIGGGFEAMSLYGTYESPSMSRTSFAFVRFRGWEVPRLSAGVDWRINRIIGVGLFARFSFARYSDVSSVFGDPQSISGEHTWFTVGARGVLFP